MNNFCLFYFLYRSFELKTKKDMAHWAERLSASMCSFLELAKRNGGKMKVRILCGCAVVPSQELWRLVLGRGNPDAH